jgi:hypothetical protein
MKMSLKGKDENMLNEVSSENIVENIQNESGVNIPSEKHIESSDLKIDAHHTKIALKTAEAIKKGKMIEVKIPIDSQNPKDLFVPVVINGYRWEIKRGEKVSIPEYVAKILEDSKYI